MSNDSIQEQHDNNVYHNDKGKFAAGNPGKPKGSSKNKLRDSVKEFLNSKWDEFPSWFDSLKPLQKIEVMLDLLPYCVPRLQAVAHTDSEGRDLTTSAINFDRLTDEDLRMLVSIQDKCLSNGNS